MGYVNYTISHILQGNTGNNCLWQLTGWSYPMPQTPQRNKEKTLFPHLCDSCGVYFSLAHNLTTKQLEPFQTSSFPIPVIF